MVTAVSVTRNQKGLYREHCYSECLVTENRISVPHLSALESGKLSRTSAILGSKISTASSNTLAADLGGCLSCKGQTRVAMSNGESE